MKRILLALIAPTLLLISLMSCEDSIGIADKILKDLKDSTSQNDTIADGDTIVDNDTIVGNDTIGNPSDSMTNNLINNCYLQVEFKYAGFGWTDTIPQQIDLTKNPQFRFTSLIQNVSYYHLNYKVRFKITNHATNHVVYNRSFHVTAQNLFTIFPDPVDINYVSAVKNGNIYTWQETGYPYSSLVNDIPSGGFVEVISYIYEPNEYIEEHAGNFILTVEAYDPTDPYNGNIYQEVYTNDNLKSFDFTTYK